MFYEQKVSSWKSVSSFTLLFLLGASVVFSAETPAAFESEVGVIANQIQQKNLAQVTAVVDQFWAEHSGEEGFVDAVRRVKDQYWENGDYDEHFDLCERIVTQFPDDPLSIGIQVDQVTGYIILKDLDKAAAKLDEFRTRYSSDERFVEYARRIKDQYWKNGYHVEHYALCERIISEFPYHPLALATRADMVRGYIYDNDPNKAGDKLEEFWTYGRSDEKFIEYARQIKDLYWEKKEYTAHYALCDRIIKEFPYHTLAVATYADVVRGYIYDNDPNTAAEKLDEFWNYGRSDENFLEYARQIKDLYWEKDQHTAHYALCDRIVREFPDDTLAVATSADIVRGYIYDDDLATASKKLAEFWEYGYSDERFLEYARQIKDLYWERKEYDAHFALCEQIVESFPDSPLGVATRVDLVTGYIYNKDFAKAAEKLEEFWANGQSDKKFVEYARSIKDLYWEEKDYPDHFALCERIIKEFPNHPLAMDTRRDIITGYIKCDQLSKAEEKLAEFIEQYRSDERLVEHLNTIANVCKDKGYHQKAAELAQWYIDQYPEAGDVIAYRDSIIRADLMAGQIETARTALSAMKAFDDDPKYVSRMHELGGEFVKSKEYATALQIYADLKKQYPDHDRAPGFQRSIVQAYLEIGDKAGVNRELGIFLSQYLGHPKFVEQAQQLAADFVSRNETDRVIEIYTGLLEALPDHEQAIRFHAGLTKAYIQKGAMDRADELVDLLERDYKSRPDYTSVVNDLGETYRGRKEHVRAINVFRKSLTAESSKEEELTALSGIAKSAVWLKNYIIDPNSYEVSEAVPNTPIGSKMDPNSPSANELVIDLIIQKLMAHYEAKQQQDYRVFEFAEEYCFKAREMLYRKNDRQQAQSDLSRAVEIWEQNVSQYVDSDYQCLMYYSMANAYQWIESYEDAINYFQKVVNDWPEFDRNWFAHFMILKCYDQLYSIRAISPGDVSHKIIDASRKYQERYPDSSVIIAVKELEKKYENLNSKL